MMRILARQARKPLHSSPQPLPTNSRWFWPPSILRQNHRIIATDTQAHPIIVKNEINNRKFHPKKGRYLPLKFRFVPQLNLVLETNQRMIFNHMTTLIGNNRIGKPSKTRRAAVGLSTARDNWGRKPNSIAMAKNAQICPPRPSNDAVVPSENERFWMNQRYRATAPHAAGMINSESRV